MLNVSLFFTFSELVRYDNNDGNNNRDEIFYRHFTHLLKKENNLDCWRVYSLLAVCAARWTGSAL